MKWSIRFELWFVDKWPRLHRLLWKHRRHHHVYIRNSWLNERECYFCGIEQMKLKDKAR